MLLHAAYLWDPRQAPVANASLRIHDGRIAYAGTRDALPATGAKQQLDLGEVLLLPGLVNTHAHTELSALSSLAYPGDFVAWIRAVLQAKNELDPQQQEQGMHEGILALLRGGTTTLGDHLSVGTSPESLLRSPLRGRAFIEVLGVVPEVAADLARAAELVREQWSSVASRFELIPSPHSVHALAPEMLPKLLRDRSLPHSIHLAESEVEYRYFAEQAGPLHDFIAERGSALHRETKSSIQELNQLGLLDERILAVHGNYLEPAELTLLAERGVSLVHCPRSHAYFGHRPFPLEAARAAGVNVALGTDSLASASTLSMLEVLRAMERSFPNLERGEIFAMATEGGAKALRLQEQIGSLETGKKADLVAVPWKGSAEASLFEAQKVCFAMIDGEIVTGF